jgi:hypothetical protein
MQLDSKKVIFIGGSSYSGSTMLDMMIANSPVGFSVGEVHALFRPFRPHHFEPECGCGNRDCDFWLQVHKSGEEQLYETIFKLLPKVSFIVDSSKDPFWIKKQTKLLQRKDIEVYNLLIWKEPASFAHSMIKRKRKGWERAWKNYHKLYFTLIDNYMLVPYSYLAQRPDQVLENLCKKCGLDYYQDKKNFWQKRHHTLFGNDSAKIHLYSTNSNDFEQYRDKLESNNDNSYHRSIYHDNSYLNTLPLVVRERIKSDPVLLAITRVLRDIKNKNKVEQIHYSSVQIFFAKTKWIIKKLTGYILGRYWYLY